MFDGHGGKQSADMCEKHLLNYLVETEAFKKGEYLEAFRAAYEKMENLIADKERVGGQVTDGCTAVTVLIVDNKVYVANVGDSECIVGRLKKKEEAKSPDDTYGYTLLTAKHLPSEAPEKERLLKAGAMVQANRINGILAVSRSFGDLEFKTKTAKGMQAVIAEPHLASYELKEGDHFLVVGCDGVWDTTTYDEAVRNAAISIASVSVFCLLVFSQIPVCAFVRFSSSYCRFRRCRSAEAIVCERLEASALASPF